jgi:hypothetical protein
LLAEVAGAGLKQFKDFKLLRRATPAAISKMFAADMPQIHKPSARSAFVYHTP